MTQHILVINNRSAKLITDVAHSIVKFVDRMLQANKARQKRRETIKALSNLSDYELRDMGISRYDIEQIANSYK